MNDQPTWQRIEPGWWCFDKFEVAVHKEHDGKWHSYVLDSDTRYNSPAFKTMREAMDDAEKRFNALTPPA